MNSCLIPMKSSYWIRLNHKKSHRTPLKTHWIPLKSIKIPIKIPILTGWSLAPRLSGGHRTSLCLARHFGHSPMPLDDVGNSLFVSRCVKTLCEVSWLLFHVNTLSSGLYVYIYMFFVAYLYIDTYGKLKENVEALDSCFLRGHIMKKYPRKHTFSGILLGVTRPGKLTQKAIGFMAI